MPNTTHKYQSDLAHFCRTGNYISIPDVNEKNIGRYRSLIYSIIDESLKSAYPLTHNLLEKSEWDKLVQDFFSNHKCKSPLIWKMPKDLLEYVQLSDYSLSKKYPFLIDLLLMERFEIEIFMMPNKKQAKNTNKGSLTKNRLIINKELAILRLSYPVHLKKASLIHENDKSQYFVCLHRHPKTGIVIFTNINLPHVELIEKLNDRASSFTSLQKIFLKYATEKEANIAAKNFLKTSLNSKLILGYSA